MNRSFSKFIYFTSNNSIVIILLNCLQFFGYLVYVIKYLSLFMYLLFCWQVCYFLQKFKNLGNTCYFNSALQVNIPRFEEKGVSVLPLCACESIRKTRSFAYVLVTINRRCFKFYHTVHAYVRFIFCTNYYLHKCSIKTF